MGARRFICLLLTCGEEIEMQNVCAAQAGAAWRTPAPQVERSGSRSSV